MSLEFTQYQSTNNMKCISHNIPQKRITRQPVYPQHVEFRWKQTVLTCTFCSDYVYHEAHLHFVNQLYLYKYMLNDI